jgi:hypothetical protein
MASRTQRNRATALMNKLIDAEIANLVAEYQRSTAPKTPTFKHTTTDLPNRQLGSNAPLSRRRNKLVCS